MPLTGDAVALKFFESRLRKMPDACKSMARQMAPAISGLVDGQFAAQSSPAGDPWPPTKSGAPAFGGSNSGGRVLSRVVRDGKAVRTTVLYPLHFHQDGTHKIGRKRGRAIASKISGGYVGGVLKSLGLGGSAPRRRKGESDDAYKARLAKFDAAKRARQDARAHARGHAKRAVEEARAAGGMHDPARPMIPDEGDPIPSRWEEVITAKAAQVMKWYGAEASG